MKVMSNSYTTNSNVRVSTTWTGMLHLQQMLQDSSKEALLFFNAMKSFVLVEHDTFGINLRSPQYRASLKQLRKHVLLLPIKKIPLKLHVICVHLEQRYACKHTSCMRTSMLHRRVFVCYACCMYAVIMLTDLKYKSYNINTCVASFGFQMNKNAARV